MNALTERIVKTNGVELSVKEAGDGFPVVLCHGFPELAYSWRHQIPALAEAGYRVLAPDQRGYGRSSRPDAIEDYDIVHLTDDLLGILDDIGEERAVFVGHDWGSMVVWQLALRAPERVAGVVGMSVPFVPRAPLPPVQLFKQVFGDTFFYILHFQEPGVADAEFDKDPATSMRRMLAGLTTDIEAQSLTELAGPNDGRGLVERLPEPERLPDWLSQAELDHYVQEFSRTGFTGGINWYRNFDRNWELMAPLAEAKVEMPAGFIAGGADPVLVMTPPGIMDNWVTDLRTNVTIPGAGHWVQQEAPAEVNAALLDFLGTLDLPR
jgi:pimeloyl-ACP methyl ester carboxylesterase